MKEIAVEQLPRDVDSVFAAAQCERVLVTRNGVPIAVVLGIEHKDEEDWQLESSPEFWGMIEERRREPDSISLKDFMDELEARERLEQSQTATVKEL